MNLRNAVPWIMGILTGTAVSLPVAGNPRHAVNGGKVKSLKGRHHASQRTRSRRRKAARKAA